jgi:hypothetical protein
MRRHLSLLAAVIGLALAAVGPARANLAVGVNDDVADEASAASWFFPTMQAEGLAIDSVTLRWDESAPATIPAAEVSAVNAVIAAAARTGVTVELDLYPLHAAALTDGIRCASAAAPLQCGDSVRIQRFAAWTAQVAQTFPAVHEFVVMNECNQPFFVSPQWTLAGTNESAEVCGRALVAAYDALHAVNDENVVWGLGLSPRGNDNPDAATNSSTSPVSFLTALGSWFRAYVARTHRTAPLLDGLDVHPYPVPQSLPFASGYPQGKDVGVANLPRLYQAFYNAFEGTPQPTIGEQAGGGLPVSVNEVGIQTSSAGLPGYSGVKAAANATGGVFGRYATQAYQASWYRQMLDLLACDPNVRIVNIFKLVDEQNLGGWQSGLYQFSPSGNPLPKQSAGAVHDWIASTGGNCVGTMRPWQPPAPRTPAPAPAPKPVTPPARAKPTPKPTPTPPPAGDPFAHGSRGYDVSYPNCRQRLPAGGFFVVGLNGGVPFSANRCFRKEAAHARRAHGLFSVYLNTGYSPKLLKHTTAKCRHIGNAQDLALPFARAYALGCSEAASALSLLGGNRPSLYWLDVERSNAWSSNTRLNTAAIRGMLDYLLAQTPKPIVGIYSARSWWREITGGWRTLKVPEWVPSAISSSSCTNGFASGPVWLRQGGSPRLDVDVAC